MITLINVKNGSIKEIAEVNSYKLSELDKDSWAILDPIIFAEEIAGTKEILCHKYCKGYKIGGNYANGLHNYCIGIESKTEEEIAIIDAIETANQIERDRLISFKGRRIKIFGNIRLVLFQEVLAKLVTQASVQESITTYTEDVKTLSPEGGVLELNTLLFICLDLLHKDIYDAIKLIGGISIETIDADSIETTSPEGVGKYLIPQIS